MCRGHCFEEGRYGRSRCSLAVVKRSLTELAVVEVVRALVLPHRLGEPTVVPLRRCGPAGPCTARGRRMPKERPGGEAGWRAVPRLPSCTRVVRHVSDVFEPRALQTLFSHKLLPKPRTAVLDAIQRARIRVSCLRFHFSGSLLLVGLTRYQFLSGDHQKRGSPSSRLHSPAFVDSAGCLWSQLHPATRGILGRLPNSLVPRRKGQHLDLGPVYPPSRPSAISCG